MLQVVVDYDNITTGEKRLGFRSVCNRNIAAIQSRQRRTNHISRCIPARKVTITRKNVLFLLGRTITNINLHGNSILVYLCHCFEFILCCKAVANQNIVNLLGCQQVPHLQINGQRAVHLASGQACTHRPRAKGVLIVAGHKYSRAETIFLIFICQILEPLKTQTGIFLRIEIVTGDDMMPVCTALYEQI